MAPKPPLPSTPKTPQNVQKKPEASKKTENKPKNDRAQQERKPPKEMMKKPAKENRQNAKNPAKEAVKKQEDRVKRVESQERSKKFSCWNWPLFAIFRIDRRFDQGLDRAQRGNRLFDEDHSGQYSQPKINREEAPEAGAQESVSHVSLAIENTI